MCVYIYIYVSQVKNYLISVFLLFAAVEIIIIHYTSSKFSAWNIFDKNTYINFMVFPMMELCPKML